MHRDSKIHSWLSRIERKPGDAGGRLLLVAVSLILTYILAILTLMTRWMNFWIRGSYYASYQAIFLTALMILLLLWLRHHNGAPPGLSTVIFSIGASYGAGLLALVFHPIFQPNGLHQVWLSLDFPAPEAALAFLWFPVKLLSWLFGGIAGLILVLVSRWFGSSSHARFSQ